MHLYRSNINLKNDIPYSLPLPYIYIYSYMKNFLPEIYMSIHEHILYVMIYVYICLNIYSYMKNFFWVFQE